MEKKRRQRRVPSNLAGRMVCYKVQNARTIFLYFVVGLVMGASLLFYQLHATQLVPHIIKLSSQLLGMEIVEYNAEPIPWKSAKTIIRIPPREKDDKATEPKVEKRGNFIEIRYDEPKGNYQVYIVKEQQAFGVEIYADNSTYKIPLAYGEGKYTVFLVEKVSASHYQTVQRFTIGTILGDTVVSPLDTDPDDSWDIDTSSPYLAPLYNINWSDDLESVRKARELCENITDDQKKAQIIYNYLVERMEYDHLAYKNLPSDYVPSMDITFISEKGVCYDFSSLYAGMMRSVGVPTKVVTGYNSFVDDYHAWNEVYYNSSWHRVDLTIDISFWQRNADHAFDSPKGTITKINRIY